MLILSSLFKGNGSLADVPIEYSHQCTETMKLCRLVTNDRIHTLATAAIGEALAFGNPDKRDPLKRRNSADDAFTLLNDAVSKQRIPHSLIKAKEKDQLACKIWNKLCARWKNEVNNVKFQVSWDINFDVAPCYDDDEANKPPVRIPMSVAHQTTLPQLLFRVVRKWNSPTSFLPYLQNPHFYAQDLPRKLLGGTVSPIQNSDLPQHLDPNKTIHVYGDRHRAYKLAVPNGGYGTIRSVGCVITEKQVAQVFKNKDGILGMRNHLFEDDFLTCASQNSSTDTLELDRLTPLEDSVLDPNEVPKSKTPEPPGDIQPSKTDFPETPILHLSHRELSPPTSSVRRSSPTASDLQTASVSVKKSSPLEAKVSLSNNQPCLTKGSTTVLSPRGSPGPSASKNAIVSAPAPAAAPPSALAPPPATLGWFRRTVKTVKGYLTG